MTRITRKMHHDHDHTTELRKIDRRAIDRSGVLRGWVVDTLARQIVPYPCLDEGLID